MNRAHLAALLPISLLLAGTDVLSAENLRRGIICEFVAPTTADSRSDTRVARLIALAVGTDRPPTPLLPAGGFRACFEGSIQVEFTDDYAFFLRGRGSASLTITGNTVLESKQLENRAPTPEDVAAGTIELESGHNAVRVEFVSPAAGDAQVQLLWSSFDFRWEPVPPMALFHDSTDERVTAGSAKRESRRLVANGRCLRCHISADHAESDFQQAMPELALDAPAFDAIGGRLHEEWMARWITHPQKMRPDASMPRLFPTTADVAPQARDIAAYLASLRDRLVAPNATTPRRLEVERGKKLFDQLGCTACHRAPNEKAQGADDNRMALEHLSSKWRRPALPAYLLDPYRHYRWSRMPNFRLSTNEAHALADYLLPETAAQPISPAPQDQRDRGKALVLAAGCLNCHSGPSRTTLQAPAWQSMLSHLDQGCLQAEPGEATPTSRHPFFGFNAGERTNLRVFLQQDHASLWRHSAEEFAARQIEEMRCTACHYLDGRPDRWSELRGVAMSLGELLAVQGQGETKPPTSLLQLRPHLTWTGEKLRQEWLQPFLADATLRPVRPWLTARMPAFPTRATVLSRGLAAQHGIEPPRTSTRRALDSEPVLLGERLVSATRGFNCVACHDAGPERAVGAFDVKGPNLMLTFSRLRRPFFDRWMLNPNRVVPEARMPQFADDEGRSPFGDILEGDARRQFAVIWQYLRSLHEKHVGPNRTKEEEK